MLKSIIQKKCVVINVYIMFNNIPINNIVHKIINVFKINPKFQKTKDINAFKIVKIISLINFKVLIIQIYVRYNVKMTILIKKQMALLLYVTKHVFILF